IAAAVLAVLLTALIVGCSFAGKGEEETVSPSPSASPTPTATAAPESPVPTPAVSPAPGDYGPLHEDMGRDQLPLPQGAVWLTEEELEDWADWFAGDWMRGQFLTSLYEKPEDVDLHELFYIGVDTEGRTTAEYFENYPNLITPEDKRAYLLHLGDWVTECPTDKLPREQMDAVLRKYLGLGLEETNRVRLSYPYIPETDCYYHAHGDTNYFGTPDFWVGYARGDEVSLFYRGSRRVVLRREGEEVRFVSNLEVGTNGTSLYASPPEVGPSIPANETGDYGADVTRLQRQAMAEAPEASEAYGKTGYGVLKYGETEAGPCLWFETVDGERYRLPTPETAEGPLSLVESAAAHEGKGFWLNPGADPDLVSWHMFCTEDTVLGGNVVRSGGWAVWTVYLPTLETFVTFRPDEDWQNDTDRAGTAEWLEQIFGGAETLSAEIRDSSGRSETVEISAAYCRNLLTSCAWTRLNGTEAAAPEAEYTMTLRGGEGELVLYQDSTLGRLYLRGREYCYR
ncbi:MAG: hypothetical protein IKX47_08900, partial [Oscillospiraceae bacterium]|nr:hypothetical protein [Oscillospiraceae bacterium]